MPTRPFGVFPGEINWDARGAARSFLEPQSIPLLRRPSGAAILLVLTSFVVNGNLPFLTNSYFGLNAWIFSNAEKVQKKLNDCAGTTVDPLPQRQAPVQRYPPGWEKTVDIGVHWGGLRVNPMKHERD